MKVLGGKSNEKEKIETKSADAAATDYYEIVNTVVYGFEVLSCAAWNKLTAGFRHGPAGQEGLRYTTRKKSYVKRRLATANRSRVSQQSGHGEGAWSGPITVSCSLIATQSLVAVCRKKEKGKGSGFI